MFLQFHNAWTNQLKERYKQNVYALPGELIFQWVVCWTPINGGPHITMYESPKKFASVDEVIKFFVEVKGLDLKIVNVEPLK